MKGLAVIALCVVFVAVASARPEEKYTNQYDNVDVDEILQSARLRTNYFNCLKTGKKCTKEGQLLRDVLPEALKTKCAKCNEKQKSQTAHVLRVVVKDYPKDFKELEKIYDPEHHYRQDYAEELKKEGIDFPEL